MSIDEKALEAAYVSRHTPLATFEEYRVIIEAYEAARSAEQPVGISGWIKTSEAMPELKRHYWISDGKDVALGLWNIKDMSWRFLYHHSVFKPTLMLPVKLPPLPEVVNVA